MDDSPTAHQTPPADTSDFTERSDSRGLWESDIFFLQKLSDFFGGGAAKEKTEKETQVPIRRLDRRPIGRPEMIPPELYHPERVDGPTGSVPLIGQPVFVPQGNRGQKKQFARQPYFFKQKNNPKRNPIYRKDGEKQPNRRRFPNSRFQAPGKPDVTFPKKNRNPIVNSYNERVDYTTQVNRLPLGNVFFTRPPKNYIHATSLPPFQGLPTTYPNQLRDSFTRTLTSSLYAGNNDNSFNGQVNVFKPAPKDKTFTPPRQSSIMFPSDQRFLTDNSLQESVSADHRVPFRNHVGIPSDESFLNLFQGPGTNKVRRKVSAHPRPAPSPQRIPMELSIESSFGYRGDDFLPSPKEGSMLDNAFQPIFRASQSLDVDLPASFMKPIHVASARSLPMPVSAAPPEILDFFSSDGSGRIINTE